MQAALIVLYLGRAASGPLHSIETWIRSRLFGRPGRDIDHALDTQHSAFGGRLGSGKRSRRREARPALAPHRRFKIIYATLYDVHPTFVVDITDQFELRLESLMAYKSQFGERERKRHLSCSRRNSGSSPSHEEPYGSLPELHAEPFLKRKSVKTNCTSVKINLKRSRN